jgi:hypothetical protein
MREFAEPVPPRQCRIRQAHLGEQALDKPVQQVVLRPDMRVERHRRHPEPFRDRAHRNGAEPALVGERERVIQDLLTSVISHRYTL